MKLYERPPFDPDRKPLAIDEDGIKAHYKKIHYIGDLMEEALRQKAIMELNPTVASVHIMFWDDVEKLESANESYK